MLNVGSTDPPTNRSRDTAHAVHLVHLMNVVEQRQAGANPQTKPTNGP